MTDIEAKIELREQLRLLIRGLGLLQKSEASCCGITLSQCHALVEIGRSGVLSPNDLAQALNLDKSTVSRSLDHLERGAYITRSENPQDRRLTDVALTPSGRQVFEELETRQTRFYAEVLADLPPEKVGQVLESLGLLVKALRNKECC